MCTGESTLAACTLKIDLDDTDKTRTAGEYLTGTVHVHCEKDANCKGLEVSTQWTTHGRGNVDSGVGDLQIVYEGRWQAGQKYSYPFKVKAASWPPTYFGTYLNVSHSVRAKAKLAWKKDPEASIEFPLVVDKSPTDLQPTRAQTGQTNIIGYMVLGLVGLIFLVMIYFFILLAIPIAIIGGLIWFFKRVLPTFKTGKVEWAVEPRRANADDVVRGYFQLRPRGGLRVNAVSYTVTCSEKCSSGSGSTRQTHTHEVFRISENLAESQILKGGKEHRFDFEFAVHNAAPPTIKLNDNEVIWSVEMRIDIPRWPDWVQTVSLVVEPSKELRNYFGIATQQVDKASVPAPTNEDEQWFDQVVDQLREASDSERKQLVLTAIAEDDFVIQLTAVEHITEDLPEFANRISDSGFWYLGYNERRELEVYMFVPDSRVPTIKNATNWRGRIRVVDFDSDEEALISRMLVE